MKTTDIIKKGTQIDTIYGYEIVTYFNGSIVYTDSYRNPLDECEYTIEDDPGEYVKTGESMFTLDEIGNLMKEVDGRNHKVSFQEDE